MIIRLVLLFFMMIASLSCTGCVSRRATTTLKLRQDITCSIGTGKLRIEAFEYSPANREKGVPPNFSEPISITADELNQMAVKSHPSLFSDDMSGWPLSVNVTCSAKRDYNYGFYSLLTLLLVPLPFQETMRYNVAVDVLGVSPSSTNVSFAVEEAEWLSSSPLGLIPVPGPSDARCGLTDYSALVNLTSESIVEATAIQLTRLDASEISKLTDQTWLAKLAIEDKNESVRKVSARKINDQSCLAEIVFNSTDYDIRATAARKIKDQAVLSKLASSDHDLNIRAYAAGRITDQKLISQLAEDRDPIIRIAAVDKMEDQALLLRISVNDREANVRQLAKNRLAKLKRDNPL